MDRHRRPPLALRLVFLGKQLARLMEHRLAARGVNRTQAMILTALRHHPGLKALDLCRPAGVEPANVTRTLQSLERLGLVERRPHPTDGRASLFHLTSTGEDQARILSETVENLSVEILQGIDPGDLPALERALASLMNNLRDQGELEGCHGGDSRGEPPVHPLPADPPAPIEQPPGSPPGNDGDPP